MPSFPRLAAAALAAGALATLAAPDARSQDGTAGVRVIRSWADDVKTSGDQTERWTFTITFDPATGETARTVTNEAGAVVEREVTLNAHVPPSDAEVEEATAIIRREPELAALLATPGAVVHGGFNLVREPGHPCGPGSRCLQFELYRTDAAAGERLRYVVVDMRTARLVSLDFDPATEGNLAAPGAVRSY
jgi:hypothetical protein